MSTFLTYSDEQTLHKKRDLDGLDRKALKSMNVSTNRLQSQDNLEQAWLPYRRLLKFISRFTHVPSYLLNNYARTIFFLVLLGLMFPLDLFITLFTLLLSYLINLILRKQTTPPVNPNAQRILISGGRTTSALQLCRSFHRAGHQIILVDESVNWLTGHRWSRSVERFYVHPSPSGESEAYVKILTNIVRKERINVFIPMTPPVNSDISTQLQASLAKYNCSIFHLDTDHMAVLSNQYTFIDKARCLDLTIPPSFLITSRQQLFAFDFDSADCSYVCKKAIPNGANEEQVIRLPRPTREETLAHINRLPVDEGNPYILQKFIAGTKYCTHITCVNGEIKLFVCSRSSWPKLNYKHVDHPAIFEWCTQYARALQCTGQMSLDFLVDDHHGNAYPIGCYPSANAALTSLYNLPHVADAYLANESLPVVVPRSTARFTYWLPHELCDLLRNIRSLKASIHTLTRIFAGKEAVWAWDDPQPFLFHYHIHFPYLLLDNLFSRHIRFFNRIDCSAGTLS